MSKYYLVTYTKRYGHEGAPSAEYDNQLLCHIPDELMGVSGICEIIYKKEFLLNPSTVKLEPRWIKLESSNTILFSLFKSGNDIKSVKVYDSVDDFFAEHFVEML